MTEGAHLIEAELSALGEGDENKAQRLRNSQKLFLDKQLLCWVPTFCSKVREKTELPFYSELARLTADMLELERERLAEHVAEDAEGEEAEPAS